MHANRALLLPCLISLGIAGWGCEMVPLQEAAAQVRILADLDSNGSAAEAAIPAKCEELGFTRVSVLSKLWFINRSQIKISEELDNLARNAAVELKGNAVMATGEIEQGGRRYQILRCPFSQS